MSNALTNNASQPYLPQIYTETDGDATRCYLFFQRMASKTDLINTVTANANNLPESLNGQVSETLVGVCEVRPSYPRRSDYVIIDRTIR